MQTREQVFAAKVYKQVSEMEKGSEDAKSYGSMAHKLPILIRTAGLAQALTFVEARGKENGPMHKLLDDLALTVGKRDRPDLLASARNAQLSEYMLLTQRVMDALLWYKRFAQSVLDVKASDANASGTDADKSVEASDANTSNTNEGGK